MQFDTSIVQTHWESPLGSMRLAATNLGLAGAWFDGQRHQPCMTDWPQAPQQRWLVQAIAQLHAYFNGQLRQFNLPLDLAGGTAFQQRVWQALCAIEFGCTVSYGALSAQLGQPAAVRAVGAAVGRNPVTIIVPCHRVLGANGALTGYAGGLDRKLALLRLEGAQGEGEAVSETRRRAITGLSLRE